MSLTPFHKMGVAVALLAAAPLVVILRNASASGVARVLLGVAAVAGLAFSVWKARGRSAIRGMKAASRLTVVQRAGLSARTGLALIEVDGRPYVVLHGEGFAHLVPTKRPQPVKPRATLRALSHAGGAS